MVASVIAECSADELPSKHDDQIADSAKDNEEAADSQKALKTHLEQLLKSLPPCKGYFLRRKSPLTVKTFGKVFAKVFS